MNTSPDLGCPPQQQVTLLGHKDLWKKLTQAYQFGTLPSALLLSGTKGLGKATFAYQFATYVLSQGKADSDFIKQQIHTGSYPNILTIKCGVNKTGTPSQTISIEEARKLFPFLQQTPVHTGWRVVVIDAVDQMTLPAANALLKILEEPPTQTLFLLVGHQLGRILLTIRSRCQRISFDPLNEEDLSPFLEEHADKALLIAASCGCLGRLKTLKSISLKLLMPLIWQALMASTQAESNQLRRILQEMQTVAQNQTGLILDLMQWWIHRLIVHPYCAETKPFFLPEESSVQTKLRAFKPIAHWSLVWHTLKILQETAANTHLDENQVLWAAFLIVEDPNLGENFVNAS